MGSTFALLSGLDLVKAEHLNSFEVTAQHHLTVSKKKLLGELSVIVKTVNFTRNRITCTCL